MRLLALLLWLCLPLAPVAQAQDFQKGLNAANLGDYAAALKEWRPLADKGNVGAQFNLGLVYDSGLGVPQDYVEAAKWYRRAAEQGFADAQNSLGALYADGNGVPKDLVQAHKWHGLALLRTAPAKREDRETARRNRDRVATQMTPAQVAEAQKQAREWQQKTGGQVKNLR